MSPYPRLGLTQDLLQQQFECSIATYHDSGFEHAITLDETPDSKYCGRDTYPQLM